MLSNWITRRIGDGWITDLPQLEKLLPLVDDPAARAEFRQIKYQNKLRLAEYIKEHNHIDVDPGSIFDVQVKRLHEYKRQLLNIIHVMYLYNKLRSNPEMDMIPRTFIFGGKAASDIAAQGEEGITAVTAFGEMSVSRSPLLAVRQAAPAT